MTFSFLKNTLMLLKPHILIFSFLSKDISKLILTDTKKTDGKRQTDRELREIIEGESVPPYIYNHLYKMDNIL